MFLPRPLSGFLLLFCLYPLTMVASTPRLEAQEGPVTFEFSFSNPGARSMALAGAFAGLADDATAAFTNPAGLVQLIEPEASMEYRMATVDTPFVLGGRANGSPTGEGIDTVSGLRFGQSTDESNGLSFASFVFPSKSWSAAIYQHTWADFNLTSQVDGLFGEVDGELERSGDVQAHTQVEVVNTGVALGFKLGSRFSLGVSAFHSQGKIDSFTAEYASDEDNFFANNPFSPRLLDTTYSFIADDSFIGVSAGFLWRPSARFSFGGYYRTGPEFDLRVIEISGPANDEVDADVIELDALSPMAFPDVLGAGVAYKAAGGRFTTSFEWTRVFYSTITDSLNPVAFEPGKILLSDVDELHLGFEYVLVNTRPIIGLRAGVWQDPAHRVGSGAESDLFERTIFNKGGDETHVVGGIGLVWSRVQIDLGADVSDTRETFSLSFVVRL